MARNEHPEIIDSDINSSSSSDFDQPKTTLDSLKEAKKLKVNNGQQSKFLKKLQPKEKPVFNWDAAQQKTLASSKVQFDVWRDQALALA